MGLKVERSRGCASTVGWEEAAPGQERIRPPGRAYIASKSRTKSRSSLVLPRASHPGPWLLCAFREVPHPLAAVGLARNPRALAEGMQSLAHRHCTSWLAARAVWTNTTLSTIMMFEKKHPAVRTGGTALGRDRRLGHRHGDLRPHQPDCDQGPCTHRAQGKRACALVETDRPQDHAVPVPDRRTDPYRQRSRPRGRRRARHWCAQT